MRNFIKTGGHHDEKRSKTTSKRMDEKIRQKKQISRFLNR